MSLVVLVSCSTRAATLTASPMRVNSGCCDYVRFLAHVEGDDVPYRDYRDRYRKMANDLGFERHMQWAAEMA